MRFGVLHKFSKNKKTVNFTFFHKNKFKRAHALLNKKMDLPNMTIKKFLIS